MQYYGDVIAVPAHHVRHWDRTTSEFISRAVNGSNLT